MLQSLASPRMVRPAVQPDTENGSSADAAIRPLWAFGILGFLVTLTGTFLYAYPETLRAIRRELSFSHQIGGDLMVAAGVYYLAIHLRRTWRMWRRVLSRWTGYGSLLALATSGLSGVYGQLGPVFEGPVWWVHAVSSIVLVVLACLHGAYGLRHRFIESR